MAIIKEARVKNRYFHHRFFFHASGLRRSECMLLFFQPFHLRRVEAVEKQCCSKCRKEIRNRFRHIYSCCLRREKVRENVDHGNEQDDFTKKRHGNASLCLTKGDEGFLAGRLYAHAEHAHNIDAHEGGRCFNEFCI